MSPTERRAMSKVDGKPPRSWREIAQLTSQEHDPQRVLELARQLIRALDAESNRRMAQSGDNLKINDNGAA